MRKKGLNDRWTWTHKACFFAFLLISLAAVWYGILYLPVSTRIRNADITGLEAEIELEKTRAAALRSMKREIDENKRAGAAVVSSYNNIKNETDELEQIFGDLSDFTFEFSEPEIRKTEVRRNVRIRCTAESLRQAVTMLESLSKSGYRGLICDVSLSGTMESGNNILSGPVELVFDYIYFETTADSESLEGLTTEDDEMEE